ncbi:MAG TPA: hypothetical protein PK447_02840 [Ignavibacteria bacterium]|nr:hypothetical protein [Ignavibacteria bacterium]
MNSIYTYDKANCLTNVNRFNVKSYSPVEAFSYDKDGNLQTLTRDYHESPDRRGPKDREVIKIFDIIDEY